MMKELTGQQYLLPAFERYAAKVGIHDGEYEGTFGQHADRTLRLAHSLRGELGLQPGDRFAVMACNGHEFLELYHAAFIGGAVITPLNLRLAGRELQLILADSGAMVVFVDSIFADHLARHLAGAADLDVRTVLIGGGDHPHDVSYEDLIELGRPAVPAEPDEDDPVVLMYTGGTTGLPKGALVDQRAEALNLYHAAMCVDLTPDRVYLHQTPMFHAASMAGVLGIPAIGGESAFVPLFEPGAVLDAIERHHVDWTLMVPTMLAMLLDHPAFHPQRLASLRDLVYGASPITPKLLQRVREAMPWVRLWQGYGMTECSSLLTMLTDTDHAAGGPRLQSAGRPVLGVRVNVRDRGGNDLGPGERGEVCVRGGNLMREYWDRPRESEAAFRDGWFHTGDIGYLDDEGYLYLVDRDGDMIVTGGENVYSIEVENAISLHPDVAEVAVIGIPHDIWGEQVHAIVVTRPGASVTAEELKAFARKSIAGYKVPKTFEFQVEPIPVSGALKPLKRELRRRYSESARVHGAGSGSDVAQAS